VGLTPQLSDGLHHFSAGGLSDGIVVVVDDESGTYWNTFTGEAMAGARVGETLATFPIEVTTAAAASRIEPGLEVALSDPGIAGTLFGAFTTTALDGDDPWLPPQFGRTILDPDARLPAMDEGLGVVIDGEARFYPLRALAAGRGDLLAATPLSVRIDPADGIPEARMGDGGRPFQIFTRWYAFSASFPDCSIGEMQSVPSALAASVFRD